MIRNDLRRRLLAAFAILTLSTCALGNVADPAHAATASIAPPQLDPFYRPPTGWRAVPAGTILRSRGVSLALFGQLPQKVRAWQLLYRTTNRAGKPDAAVTTVLLPDVGSVSHLVSYQVPEDASAPQCAMSYTFREGAGISAPVNQVEILAVDALVAAGYGVSMPDYEGLDAQWGAPRQPGYAILDGLRAAESFSPMGLHKTTPTALWGYSGGSLATGWAAEVQPKYAPELNIRGAVVGGFATNVASILGAINRGAFAGFMPAILPGMLRGTPALNTAFSHYLKPSGKTLFARGGRMCDQTALQQYAFLDLGRYLTAPLPSFLKMPEVRAAFDSAALGGVPPRIPMFIYHAVNDEIVPIGGTDRVASAYCAHGASVMYTRDLLSEHAVLEVVALPAVLAWLHQQFVRTSPPGCRVITVPSMAISANGVPGLSPTLRGVLLALSGLYVGA